MQERLHDQDCLPSVQSVRHSMSVGWFEMLEHNPYLRDYIEVTIFIHDRLELRMYVQLVLDCDTYWQSSRVQNILLFITGDEEE